MNLLLPTSLIALLACSSHADDWSRSKQERVKTKSGPWFVRAVTVREGDGPPNISFQVAWRPDGSAYAVSSYEYDNHPELIYSFHFKGTPTRFTNLRAYDVQANDLWTEKGQLHKQFPTNVFVGKAVEDTRPVTYAWVCWEKDDKGDMFKPRQVLKIFGSDTRHLDGLEHGQPGEGDYLVEHAKASWIAKGDWPAQANSGSDLSRKWKWAFAPNRQGFPKFVSERWKLER